jgi:hypothetical protein
MIADNASRVAIPPEAARPEGMDVLPNVASVRDEYMATYPESDLAQVLSGAKSFADAIRHNFEN